MITLTHIPLFFSQTRQSIEQYYKLLKGTQMLSGAAQKKCLLICHILFFMALVQPIQSQHSTDIKSGLFHFIKGIMKLELNRELSLDANSSKVIMSGDFKIWLFQMKKKKEVMHTQKYRRFKFMQNSNQFTIFLYWNVSSKVWMASEFSVSGSGNQFKKISLLLMELFCLVLLMQVQQQQLRLLFSPQFPLFLQWTHCQMCAHFLTPWNLLRYFLSFIYASVCITVSSLAFWHWGFFQEVAAHLLLWSVTLSCAPWRSAVKLEKKFPE